MRVTFSINGSAAAIDVGAQVTLLEAIRESLALTGSKEACGVGECGNCMVIMDGAAVPSCLILAPDAAGSEIVTIEGLAADGELDRVQQAFAEEGAFQCGFCTPGMIITAAVLLAERPEATPNEIRSALSGVLCRCGSHTKILKALDALAGRGTE